MVLCMIVALSSPSGSGGRKCLFNYDTWLHDCLQCWYLIQKKILWIFMMTWIWIPAAVEVPIFVLFFLHLSARVKYFFFLKLKICMYKHMQTHMWILKLYSLVQN